MPIDVKMDIGKVTQSIGDLVGSSPSVVDSLYASMVHGGQSFWVAVYAPYMNRDLTNSHVLAMIDRGLKETRGSYKVLLELFNIPQEEYKKFLNFLRKHDLQLNYRLYRHAPKGTAVQEPNMSAEV